MFEACAKSINDELLPNQLSNPAYNEEHRNFFSLSIREAGLNILKPEYSFKEYQQSV